MSRGDLFIVGGNEDKTGAMPVLAKFVEISRARPGPIGILTTATNYPEETGEEYSRVFEDIGAPGTVCFHIRTREEAEEDRLEEQLEQLASLYITGGDQVRLTSILGGTAFYSALQKVWRKGLVIGGTSAGAAVMSRQMIMSSSVPGGGGQLIVEMGAGFGFLEDVIIDQHFSQRARFTRLMNAIAHNPQIIGVGVDENTAIWVQEEGSFLKCLENTR
ncbi:cyanophycinase [Paenibacillus sp. CC-CFT747]|nr:cyanophycinase [Paenibacillus sp. CC-CFT747]